VRIGLVAGWVISLLYSTSAAGFDLESPAFRSGAEIPIRYTCEGVNESPPLRWSHPPHGTRSLVLILDDPDAPDPAAPRGTWVHWVLYNLPPDSKGLAQGVEPNDLPAGTRQGMNDWKRTGFRGACPPIGRHRYFHRLYALDIVLPDLRFPSRRRLERAMHEHVLGAAELIGMYGKEPR